MLREPSTKWNDTHSEYDRAQMPMPRKTNRTHGYNGQRHGLPLLLTYPGPLPIAGSRLRRMTPASGEKPNRAHCNTALLGLVIRGLSATGYKKNSVRIR